MAEKGKYVYDYPRPMVTVDTLVLRRSGKGLELLLIRRGREPFRGKWALPGGFVEMDEPLEEAAARELAEETGITIDASRLEQVGAFGAPDRDPRGRSIGIAFLVVLQEEELQNMASPVAGDDAADTRWFALESVPELAFDHADILAKALHKLRTDSRFAGTEENNTC